MTASRNLAPNSDNDTVVWGVPLAEQLVWLGWEGFYMVFHPASGEMHLLDALAREIVDVVAETPCTTRGLLAEMARILEGQLSPELSDKIIGSLAELDKIGLVEPVDSVAAPS